MGDLSTTYLERVAATIIPEGIRVYLKASDGKVYIAGTTEEYIGVTISSAAAGETVRIKLRSHSGLQIMKSAGSIDNFDTLYPAAAGRVANSGVGVPVGQAIGSTAGAGEPIAVNPFNSAISAGGGALNPSSITMQDGGNIILNATTGTELGSASTQKLGFWGATAVVQPAHNADPAACAAMTHSVGTGADGTTPNGAEFDKVRTDLDALKTVVDANNVSIDALNADAAITGLTAAS